MRRPRNPTVILQTSSMDCGPASLSSLLAGLGAPASYEALRDVCATDVDGTSIDAIEDVAVSLGCDAEQLILPGEHVLASPDDYLPAIAVFRLPDGFPHFVVVWRVTRRHVIVMDPASGRRRMSRREFLDRLYLHRDVVASDDWREWAAGDRAVAATRRRLSAARVGPARADALIDAALADASPSGLARLDAALRIAESHGGAVDPDAVVWSAFNPDLRCRPADDADDVDISGAVIVTARHFDAAEGEPELLTRLSDTEPSPRRTAIEVIGRPTLRAVIIMLAAMLIAVPTLAELIAIRPLVEPETAARLDGWRLAIIVASAPLGVLAYALAFSMGRTVDVRMRTAWWNVTARLPDSFLRTRPLSDITERAHLLHRTRELPVLGLRLAFSVATLVGCCVVCCVLAPTTIPLIVVLALLTSVGPIAAFGVLADADLQTRTVSGTLARFTYDALLGAEAVQACGCAPALMTEQLAVLDSWRRTQRTFIRRSVGVRLGIGLASAVLIALIVDRMPGSAATVLLAATLAVLAVDSSNVMSDALRSLSEARSSVARISGPLNTTLIPPPGRLEAKPAQLELRGVSVVFGAATIVDDVSIVVAPGAKVALVGASGSGKSSLLAVIAGWLVPTSGEIKWAGRPADLVALRRQIAWSAHETRLWNVSAWANVEYGAGPGADSVRSRLTVAEAAFLAEPDRPLGSERVGEAGSGLSGGEAQRVRFARALGRPQSPLVLLDEAFSNVERPRRARLLRAALETWAASTVICALHDLALLDQFDYVLVMADGKLLEHGSPESLAGDPHGALSALMAQELATRFAGYQRVDVIGRAR